MSNRGGYLLLDVLRTREYQSCVFVLLSAFPMVALASQLGLALVSLLSSLSIAEIVRRNAVRLHLVQTPNHRSSHTVPTPSGGGVGIAIVGSVAGFWLAHDHSSTYLYVAAAAGGLAAIVGLLDDRFELSSRLRLALQCVLVAALLGAVGGLPGFGTSLGFVPIAAIYLIVAFCGVWWINLFNFMDGVDGLAGSQAVFMAIGALSICLASGGSADYISIWTLVLSSAVIGFLLLNWQPAKIFMGDAGSNYLATWLLAMTLYMIADGYLSYAAAAILCGTFVADASVTLVRRVSAGEAWRSAHRNHAYQKMSRRWQSHSRVALLYLCINVLWLYPLAFVSQAVPSISWVVLLVAYLPVIVFVLLAGAGKPDLAR